MEELRDKNGLTEAEYLAAYKPGDYARPSVAVDMVIFSAADTKEENYRKLPQKELKVLLIQRGGHPYLGTWALPGGFVEPNETTEQAAQRELSEETGVENIYLEQLYTFSEPNRDPRTWVMSCSYLALIDSSKVSVSAGDDARRAEWFTVRLDTVSKKINESSDLIEKITEYKLVLLCEDIELSGSVKHTMKRTGAGIENIYEIIESNGIAFDHARIISYAVERLRGKVQYTDIALNLVPEYFTLTELQQVYEVILGTKLIKAPFRRKYGAMLCEPSEKTTSDAGHRPSRLYRRKWLTE
ncbi:MAG: NUDIX hydrolase [Clostridia bacterium]|nr:NUDIX hydrolase [Clostridia bacterium]MBR2176716.1 NUDIX hydrolase [Clostridia bacterium]